MNMKFMMIVKSAERSGFPPKELMDAIDHLSQDAAKAGTMIGSGGLGPTALGARVRLSDGKVTVIDGPFTEAKEIIGGYAQFELNSKQQAIESAVRFMELHKKHWPGWEGETEVRQMFGPEDFGPENCAPKVQERSPAAAGGSVVHLTKSLRGAALPPANRLNIRGHLRWHWG